MIYTARIAATEDGEGYAARVPDVPGCVTTGRTLAETLDNVRDALSGCLCVLEDEGVPLPEPRTPDAFAPEPGVSNVLVDVDTVRYRMMTDTRAVRKNVSLPAWMAAMADARGVNCSQVLQDALRALLS